MCNQSRVMTANTALATLRSSGDMALMSMSVLL